MGMATAETDQKDARPDPDDPRKPDSPTDLTKPSLFYVLRKTAREFQRDQCTDLAAALTYYAVLSLFPALLWWFRCSVCSAKASAPRTRCWRS